MTSHDDLGFFLKILALKMSPQLFFLNVNDRLVDFLQQKTRARRYVLFDKPGDNCPEEKK